MPKRGRPPIDRERMVKIPCTLLAETLAQIDGLADEEHEGNRARMIRELLREALEKRETSETT